MPKSSSKQVSAQTQPRPASWPCPGRSGARAFTRSPCQTYLHPLYTYTADTAPGQANGNGINAYGGVWHEVTVSGAAAPASNPSSGGGGY
jgi:hypothetical protein